MRQANKTSIGAKAGLAFLAVTLVMTGTLAFAQQETILHSFGGSTDGISSGSGLVFDAAGNLYGTTGRGGAYGGGTVFELSPQPGGGWTEKTLRYLGSGTDAKAPLGSLVFDADGNLYGTSLEGGAYGEGTVFELFAKPGGGWREQDKILHSFNNNGQDGYQPWAGPILDSSGNLYGTAALGGTSVFYYGTVYELERRPGGGWSERILCSFDGPNGDYPEENLIFDTVGNLYGTAQIGGLYAEGVAFEMTPTGGGVWAQNVIYNFPGGGTFNSSAGYYPSSALIFDTAGNLYGVAGQGGAYDGGVAFEFVPTGGGSWTANVLHNFGASGDGTVPNGNLVFDAAGNLYGVAALGGAHDAGMVYEITP